MKRKIRRKHLNLSVDPELYWQFRKKYTGSISSLFDGVMSKYLSLSED